jgi:hypothetical protein
MSDERPRTIPEMINNLEATGRGIGKGYGPPPVFYDHTPARTEENTRRAADEAAEATQYMRSLTEAMTESVRLSAETRADAAQSREDTRRSGRHALIIGYSSLGLAVASAVIALIALVNGLQ